MKTNDIYNDIIEEKESGAYPELEAMNSDSNVSIWRLIMYIVSYAIAGVYNAFDNLKAWIVDVFSKNQVGTLEWWIKSISDFQYGDALQFIDGKYVYSIVDETKQIVKRVALETLNYILVFKVAGEDVGGNLISLTTVEKSALLAFVNKIKLPGTYVGIYSANPDNLKINLRVYYNPEYIEGELTELINAAADDYLKNIVFNGEFIITELTDKLQLIEGIENPVVQSVYTKANSSPDTDYHLVEDYANAVSGYYEITELNIEFISHV